MRTYKCLLLFSLVISNGFGGCCGGGKENNSSGKENNGSGSGKDTTYKGPEREIEFSYGNSGESVIFDDYEEVNNFNDLIKKDIFVSPDVLKTLGFSKSKNGFKNSNNINVFGFCKDVYEKIFSTKAILNTISTKKGNEKINDENDNSSERAGDDNEENEDDTKNEEYKKIKKTNTTKENILESVFETLSCHYEIKYDKDKIGIKAIDDIFDEGKKLVEEKEVIEKKKQNYLKERENILNKINQNASQKKSSNDGEIEDNTGELDSEKEKLDSKIKEVKKKLTKIRSERDEFFNTYTRSLKDLFKRSGFDGVINYFSFYLCGGNLSNVEIDTIKSFLKYIFGLKIPSDIDFRIEKSNDGSGEYLLILSDSVYSLIQNLLESTYLTNDRHLNSIVSVIMKCILHNKNSNKSSAHADELSNKENKEEINKSNDVSNDKNRSSRQIIIKRDMKMKDNEEEEEKEEDDADYKKVKKDRVKKEKEEEKKNFVYIRDIDGYFMKDDNKKILIPIKDMVKLSCNFLRYYLKNFTSSFNIGGVGYKCIHIKTSLLDGEYKVLRNFVVKHFEKDRELEKNKNSDKNDNNASEEGENNVKNDNNCKISCQRTIELISSSSYKKRETEFNKVTKEIEKKEEVKDSKDFKGLFDKIKGKLEILLNECGLFKLLKIKDDLLVLMKSCGLFDLFRNLYDVFDIVAEGSLLAEERYNLKSYKKNGKISDFFHREEGSGESTGGEGDDCEKCRNLRMNFLADFFSMPKGILVKKIKSMNFVSFLKFMLGRFNNFSENLENFLSKDYFKDIFKIEKIKLERKTESTTEVESKVVYKGEIKSVE